jgi:hypothetical protein
MSKKFLLVLLVLVLASSMVAAEDLNSPDTNAPKFSLEYGLATSRLARVQSNIVLLRDEGFVVQRFADDLFVVKQLLENNKNKEIEGDAVSYDRLFEKLDSLSDLIGRAKLVKDELFTLKNALAEATKELDMGPAQELYANAEQEFVDQRYEKALELVDKTYEKILELQSFEAKTSAIYAATSKNLLEFVKENWEKLAAIIAIPIILFLIFRKKIRRASLAKKINQNELEIDVLKNEIKNTQQRYFIGGGLSESEYMIKMNIYSEKVRDLNKDIALLQEELARTKHFKKVDQKNKDQQEKELHKKVAENSKQLKELEKIAKKKKTMLSPKKEIIKKEKKK